MVDFTRNLYTGRRLNNNSKMIKNKKIFNYCKCNFTCPCCGTLPEGGINYYIFEILTRASNIYGTLLNILMYYRCKNSQLYGYTDEEWTSGRSVAIDLEWLDSDRVMWAVNEAARELRVPIAVYIGELTRRKALFIRVIEQEVKNEE